MSNDNNPQYDIEHEMRMVNTFAAFIYEGGRDYLRDNEDKLRPGSFMAMNEKVRDIIGAYVNPKWKEEGVPAAIMVYIFLSVGVLNAMDTLDRMTNPGYAPETSPEVRDMWLRVKSDWRASGLAFTFEAMLMNLRASQADNNSLPLDMLVNKNEGEKPN